MNNKNNYKKGQMVWWNIFEYHTKGMLNDSEFAELMDTIYYFRQNKEKYNTLTLSPKVELVWQALREVIAKSDSNHRSYEKNKETDGEIDENHLQLLLGLLQERNPQKSQTINGLFNSNPSISGFCETNRINKATQERAWEIYKQQ